MNKKALVLSILFGVLSLLSVVLEFLIGFGLVNPMWGYLSGSFISYSIILSCIKLYELINT